MSTNEAGPSASGGGGGGSNGEASVPQHFLCTLTRRLMKDPMRAPCGHHFDKATVAEWTDTNPPVRPRTSNDDVSSGKPDIPAVGLLEPHTWNIA